MTNVPWTPRVTARPSRLPEPASPILGPAFLASAPAALIAAVPSALRVASRGFGLLVAWVVIAGLLVMPVLLATAATRAARSALSAPSSTVTRLTLAAALALALALPVQGVLGALLKAHTHHRPLAGATFAVLAFGVYATLAVVGYRLAALATRNRASAQDEATLRTTAVATCGLTLTLGSVAALGLSLGGAPLVERTLLLDVALALAVVAVGTFVDAGRWRYALWLGGAFVAGLLVVAGALARSQPGLLVEVDAQVVLAAPWAAVLRTAGITP